MNLSNPTVPEAGRRLHLLNSQLAALAPLPTQQALVQDLMKVIGEYATSMARRFRDAKALQSCPAMKLRGKHVAFGEFRVAPDHFGSAHDPAL
ncbi:hypothetical protein G7054_g12143 [Neopestalotiopsis clavispora]|nr:hypothetical protein G7054_g12143 [Neopestalotiopsis clavispora]